MLSQNLEKGLSEQGEVLAEQEPQGQSSQVWTGARFGYYLMCHPTGGTTPRFIFSMGTVEMKTVVSSNTQ